MSHQTIGRGGTITLDADFVDGAGVLVDADPVTIDILDPNDLEVVSSDAPTSNPSLGRYTYDYAVAADALLGLWTIRWSGTVNGSAVSGEEHFEVVAAGQVQFPPTTLCSIDDFETWLGETITDTDRATLALQIATAAVRTYTGQTISEATTTETLDGNGVWKMVLFLSERPVTEVASVVADDESLTEGNDEDYVWYQDGRLIRIGSFWPRLRQSVVVEYTHGYATIPADICGVVFEHAKRVFRDLANVRQESIGSYSVTYAMNPTAGLTDDEKRTLDSKYRVPVVA